MKDAVVHEGSGLRTQYKRFPWLINSIRYDDDDDYDGDYYYYYYDNAASDTGGYILDSF